MTAGLAELIGRTSGKDTRLRQAIVTAAPSAGTCTIRFGDLASTTAADDIAGVRMLSSASVSNGDTVWVLQTGGALLIIGRIAQQPDARIGLSPSTAYGPTFVSVDHTGRSWLTPGNYVVLADTNNTYVNCPTGGAVWLRANNTNLLQIVDGGTFVFTRGTIAGSLGQWDANTLRSDVGFSQNQLFPHYLRGWGNTDHMLIVPAVASYLNSSWGQDGPVLKGYAHVMIGSATQWQAVSYPNGLAIYGALTVGNSTTQATAQDAESITTYAGGSGISMRQRSRAYNDATARTVVYADQDWLRLWQGMDLVIMRNSGGLTDIRLQSWPTITGSTMVISGSSGQFSQISSRASIKKDIRDLDDKADNNPIWRLRPRQFKWDEKKVANGAEYNRLHPDGTVGLVTEEIHAVIPHATHPGPDGLPTMWDERVMIAYLVDAVQFLKKELEKKP